MSSCGGNCSCGSDCKCGSGCKCGNQAVITGVSSMKLFNDGLEMNFGAENDCKCGSGCSCVSCSCK